MIERAEQNDRPPVTESDRRKFKGIARAPLARKWLLRKFIDANDRAEQATDEATRDKWTLVAERARLEMRRLGMDYTEQRS